MTSLRYFRICFATGISIPRLSSTFMCAEENLLHSKRTKGASVRVSVCSSVSLSVYLSISALQLKIEGQNTRALFEVSFGTPRLGNGDGGRVKPKLQNVWLKLNAVNALCRGRGTCLPTDQMILGSNLVMIRIYLN